MTPPTGASAVRLDALAAVCLLSLVVGLAGSFAWRWLAEVVLDVPAGLPSVDNADLVLGALIPAVGNGIGFFASYRRPSRRSLPLLVVPSSLLTCVGLAVALSQVPDPSDVRAVAVTVVAVLITPVLIVALLVSRTALLLRTHARAGSATA